MKIIKQSPYLQTFKSDCYECDSEPSKDSKIISWSENFGPDEYHPMEITTNFHSNGKIASIDLVYVNGKYAKGKIHEEYDESGKHINYEA